MNPLATLKDGKLGQAGDLDAFGGLHALSGLAVDVDGNTLGWGRLINLNPALLAWAGKEMLPEAGQAMCGSSAKELYDAYGKDLLIPFLETWKFLASKGLLKKTISEEKLSAERNGDKKGVYSQSCQAVAGKKVTSGTRSIQLNSGDCWWLLRRQVKSNLTPELGRFLKGVLEHCDEKALKQYGRFL